MKPSRGRMAFCYSTNLTRFWFIAILAAFSLFLAACSGADSADADIVGARDVSSVPLALPLQSDDYPVSQPTQQRPSTGYPSQPTATPATDSYPVASPTRPLPTATAVPPTATSVPPTATPVPPTATNVPPTATALPTAAPTEDSSGSYPAVPTATTGSRPYPAVTATADSGNGNPYPVATETVAAPTATAVPTQEPTATATSVPPSATPTPRDEPSATPAPLPTSTTRPRPTNTPQPTATPVPPTSTPRPTATPTRPAPIPTATPIVLPTQAPVTPNPTATAQTATDRVLVRHRVLPGENLFSISRFYAVSVSELVSLNNIANNDLIYTNQTLIVPLRPGIQLPTNASTSNVIQHVVQPGETLGYLSVKYDVPLSRLVTLNSVSDPDLILIGTPLLVPLADGTESVGSSAEFKTINHAIRPGETLSGISAFYNVSQGDLIRLNNISDPDLIFTGLTLQVPVPVTQADRNALADSGASDDSASGKSVHTVRTGDTLIGVAARYNVSVLDLARLNGIAADAFIFNGQTLALPANASVAVASEPVVAEDADSAEVTPEPVETEAPSAASTPAPSEPEASTGTTSTDSPAQLELASATGSIYMIVEGSLMRLNAESGVLDVLVAVEPIVDPQGASPFGRYAGTGPTILGSRAVIDFRVSEDERSILVLRAYESAETIAYDILLVDAATAIPTTLVANMPTVLDIEWSGNEEWVSFIRVDNASEASVFAMQIDPVEQPIYIGSCQLASSGTISVGCHGLAPDTAEDSVLYVDGRGLWRSTFDGFAPTLLADYSDSGALIYDPISWSSDGRYLLMWGGYIEGGQRFVYDSVSERVAPVPFSSSYIYISAVSWIMDDQLLVLSPSDPRTGQRPVASIFNVDGDSDTFLTMSRDISIPTVGEYSQRDNGNPGVQIWSPPSYDGQRGPFAIISTDDRESGVYVINLNDATVTRLNGLPQISRDQFLREVVWAPDGQSAMMVYSLGELTNEVYWISAEADTPTALPLSEAICCIQWK